MHSSSGTSLSLLERIRTGDANGWRRLVELYGPLVRHWCLRFGIQDADAEDLAQEVFQAALLGIDSFQRDRPGDTFRGWLRAITRHKVLNFWRANAERPDAVGGSEALRRLQELPEQEVGDVPEDNAQISAVFHRALEMMRGEFEPHTWQAFWRTVVDALPATEVAEELGMTPSAVRMSKSRVLRRLREELGDLVEQS